MQTRMFNTTGYCNPGWHYIINPLRNSEEVINRLIRDKYYFVIHAPRQTGKTTLLHTLVQKYNKEGQYTALVFSVERAGYRSISVQEANHVMMDAVQKAANFFLPTTEHPPNPDDYKGRDLNTYMTEWAKAQKKPLVLFIDEIDSLYDDVLVSVLRQLRDGFQHRPKNFPSSVALVGLRDVREYKERVRDRGHSIGSGSPFNIKAESLRLENFSRAEVAALYQQYTDETGQAFPPSVIDRIYAYTAGQPWLVNAMAREITDKILNRDYTAAITPEMADQAKERLIQRRDTHLDSLMDKLMEPRIKPIIAAILTGGSPASDSYNDNLQYALDLGIVTDTQDGIKIANSIYAEIIPRILNKQLQDTLAPLIKPAWFVKDGKLQFDSLLQEFQKFYRRNAESWMDQFSYKEAGKQLLLMAFLQRIVNSGGAIDREMALGSRRCDLAVHYGGECFVLELKIRYDSLSLEDGLDQLSAYMDTYGQAHGYLLLFEPKPSSKVPWEKRLGWRHIKHSFLGTNRDITLVGM